MTTLSFERVLCGFLAAAFAFLGASPALADYVIVKRHVTLREAPARSSSVVQYPEIGTSLRLLDDGSRNSGYFHVALRNGRTGWIYFTFVERRPGDPPDWAIPLTAGGNQMSVHYIDVDQGAAALIEFPCAAILIDAGGRGQAASDHLNGYLDAFFARRADLGRRLAAVFVTHTHVDHNSNLRRIADHFSIGGYIHNGILTGSGRAGARWMDQRTRSSPSIPAVAVTEAMVEGAGEVGLSGPIIDPVSCTGIDPGIRILSGSYTENPGWPDGEFDNGNNQSLVIRIDFDRASFLFTGDMEETALETLVDHYRGRRLLDVDVYEVGHHGSHNGTTQELLDAMTPQIAVISMGPMSIEQKWTAWAYGHPRRDVVEKLAVAVSGQRTTPKSVKVADRVKQFSDMPMPRAIYATGWDGDVVVHANSAGAYSVETAR